MVKGLYQCNEKLVRDSDVQGINMSELLVYKQVEWLFENWTNKQNLLVKFISFFKIIINSTFKIKIIYS